MPRLWKSKLKAKQSLNYSDEKFSLFEAKDKSKELWGDIADGAQYTQQQSFMARLLGTAAFDVTNQKQLDLIKKKDPVTGEFVPLGLKAVSSVTKENYESFMQQFSDAIETGTEYYDFNNVAKTGNIKTITKSEHGSIFGAETKLEAKHPKVSRPNFFKRAFNRMFGAFKKDFEKYNNYVKEQEDLGKFTQEIDKNKEVIADAREKEDVWKTLHQHARDNKVAEDRLTENLEKEANERGTIEVVAGRSNALVGNHENYQKIIDTPLDKSSGLPMDGLALLAVNSFKLNEGVKDMSSPVTLKYQLAEGQTLTAEEEVLLDNIKHEMTKLNMSAKGMSNMLNGFDVNRMGGRMECVIKGRDALNNAAAEYAKGNKGPLADLINDSLEIVIDYSKKCDKPDCLAAGAFSEMVNACEQIFDKDPDFRKMINLSEQDEKIMKGAAKTYDMLKNPAKQAYEAYCKDKGPGTPERKAIVEDMMFKKSIKAMIAKDIRDKNEIITDANAKEREKYADFVAKFGKNSGLVQAGLDTLNINSKKENPRIFEEMGKSDFNMESFKEKQMQSLRSTPEYEKMMNMSVEELGSCNVDELASKAVNRKIDEKVAQMNQKQIETKEVVKEQGLAL